MICPKRLVSGHHHFDDLQILVGNKCDMDESKRKVPYSKGQALADEFGIRFFETSAKTNSNVDDVRLDHNRGALPDNTPKLDSCATCLQLGLRYAAYLLVDLRMLKAIPILLVI